MPEIVSLGEHTVNYGRTGDPHRIEELVGRFNSWLDLEKLDSSCFVMREDDPKQWHRAGIASWPEGEKQVELLAVNFGEPLPDYAAVLEKVSLLPGYQTAGFCHLATHFSTEKVVALYQQGIPRIEATDRDSLLRNGDGPCSLCASCLRCGPSCHALGACWVGFERYADGWFLLCRE